MSEEWTMLLHMIHIDGEYNLSLVSLSIIIAIVASYAAITLNERLMRVGIMHYTYWIILASLTMGLGIWAMHFIGMSAYESSASFSYNWFLTGLSVLPAIGASLIAFWLVYIRKIHKLVFIIAGIVMGIGIAGMHYMGMEAMQIPNGYLSYDMMWLILSVVVAILISLLALYILMNQGGALKWHHKAIVSLLLGFGISSMHYTGMRATTLVVNESQMEMASGSAHSMEIVVMAVTAIIGIMISFSLYSSLFDQQLSKRLKHYDLLTKLPNRKMFINELKQCSDRSPQTGVAIIHLHDLETINTKYSYQFGDDAIIKLVRQLRDVYKKYAFRNELRIYRLSNQKLAVIYNDRNVQQRSVDFSRELLQVVKNPIVIGEEQFYPSLSIGISLKPETAVNPDELIEQAYAVINVKGDELIGQYAIYRHTLHQKGLKDKLIERLRLMEFDRELNVVYQPKISNTTQEMVGVEALLRWEDRQMGKISPAKFIPVAEETGDIYPITLWVIEQCLKQVKQWKELDIHVDTVAINLSGKVLSEPNFTKDLDKLLLEHKVPASKLEFEVTETSVVRQEQMAVETINHLKKLGATIALDDFGTGFSSLTYLRKLPLDKMKIDKSFLEDITHNKEGQQFLSNVVNLGKSIGLQVVVEGVEIQEELDIIRGTKVDEIQGFYYAKPMSSGELVPWLDAYEHDQQVAASD
ncbi:putative bifunctional diguanylate cyclase/phosphodiesterase [Halalkalibacillus halophilus]|uniref:putative bifunctional diguanylate cyclase/phosphodiesterase n=1 Tax=Halalkalibacillus halophilus TaxID=392827 RepID=UPI0003FD790F|nr:EAL domain-containing protein [Halalkalibacillus halophilus]